MASALLGALLLELGAAGPGAPRVPLGLELVQQPASQPSALVAQTLPAEVEAALERALDWLDEQQRASPDGALCVDGQKRPPLAGTALAALAYLAAGSTPGRGPHGPSVERAIDYLVAQADLEAASESFGYVHARADQHSKMHGHGYATLALAEAWCVARSNPRGPRLEQALRAAVGLIERTQGANGGWYYEPRVDPSDEGSTTICMIQALRAARDAGLHVDAGVVQRAESYVLKTQDEDGVFRYQLGSPDKTLALTAAAMATLNMTGQYEGRALERGLDALRRGLIVRREGGRPAYEQRREQRAMPICAYYERLYIAQALWQQRDLRWFDEWMRDERALLLAAQRADGAWEDPEYGSCYATAVNALVLALPLGYLPIFQR